MFKEFWKCVKKELVRNSVLDLFFTFIVICMTGIFYAVISIIIIVAISAWLSFLSINPVAALLIAFPVFLFLGLIVYRYFLLKVKNNH